jgi:ABC-type Fe3+-hydroxamate transport system substrate-binding protein
MPLRIYDDRGRELLFLRPPQRVVSLVPSDTLSVFALGAGERLVGRTRYCVAPEGQVERVPAVGGTKDVDVEAVARLLPDLILANQEENARPQIEALAKLGFPTLVAFPKKVAEGHAHLARLARVLGVEAHEPVRALLREGLRALSDAEQALARRPPLRVFVPIWREPLMTIAGDTFLSDALRLAGAENVFADRRRAYPLAADLGKQAPRPAAEVGERDTRYPRIAVDEVVQRAPQAILLPDEPHPFGEEDAAFFRSLPVPAARDGRVALCSGRDLCWYGSHSVQGLPRLRALVDSLHP